MKLAVPQLQLSSQDQEQRKCPVLPNPQARPEHQDARDMLRKYKSSTARVRLSHILKV